MKTNPQIQHLPPDELSVHETCGDFPRLCPADYAVLKESISADRQVREPLLITTDKQIVDGRHRYEIALLCKLPTGPCVVTSEEPGEVCLRTALARRQLTITGKCLLLIEHHPTLFASRKARKLANLKCGKTPMISRSEKNHFGEPKGYDDLANRYQIPREYFSAVASAMDAYSDEDWEAKRLKIFAGELHAYRLEAGVGGLGQKQKPRAPDQPFRLIRKAFATLQNQLPKWADLETQERRALIESYRQVKAVIPKELQ